LRHVLGLPHFDQGRSRCLYTTIAPIFHDDFAVTLWAFLSQVMFEDEQRSCLAESQLFQERRRRSRRSVTDPCPVALGSPRLTRSRCAPPAIFTCPLIRRERCRLSQPPLPHRIAVRACKKKLGKYGKANCLMRSVKQFAFPPQRHDNFCIFPDIIEAKAVSVNFFSMLIICRETAFASIKLPNLFFYRP
jgi:hypothetical protein